MLALIAGLSFSFEISTFLEKSIYQDEVIFSKQTVYQRIVVTRFKDDVRLFINGDLQFSSIDEYRYHEPLVHLPMSLASTRERVLILGGGDGMALREVEKYPDVKQVTLVDIDPEMTKLGSHNLIFANLNNSSFSDHRVKVINEDGFKFVENYQGFFQ